MIGRGIGDLVRGLRGWGRRVLRTLGVRLGRDVRDVLRVRVHIPLLIICRSKSSCRCRLFRIVRGRWWLYVALSPSKFRGVRQVYLTPASFIEGGLQTYPPLPLT